MLIEARPWMKQKWVEEKKKWLRVFKVESLLKKGAGYNSMERQEGKVPQVRGEKETNITMAYP